MPNEASKQIEIIQQRNPGAVVSGRGKRRLDFDFLNGRKGQLLSLGSWHYGPNNDQEIDTDWAASAVQPWLWQMVKADFNVYAMPGNASFNAGQIIKYVHPESGSEITFQPQQLQWTNDLNQISAVANVADVAGVVSENIITWPGAYGAGTSFDWAVQADRLQKRLTINSLAAPPAFVIAGGNPVLRTQFIIGKSSNVAIWIDGVRHDEKNKTQIDSVNAIEFRDTATQTVLWYFESASAWDSRTTNEKNVPTVATRVRSTNQSVFIEILTPWSWLETAVFPITIDPSITPQVAADAADGLTYSGSGFSTSYNQWFIGNDGDTLWPFAYIAGVTIPDGATIDASYLIIVAASTKSGTTVNTRIQFEDAANPTAPTSYATWAARTLTTTYVDWNSIAAWTNGATYNSPEIKTIIQELVDSYDYSSGATMGILGQYIAATSYRHGTDYHGSSANAVKLYIEYTEAGGGTETADVSPVTVSVLIPSVTAAYVQTETAAVAPLAVHIIPTSTTATYIQVETGSVSPVPVSLSIATVTATYSQTVTAAVAPLVVGVTVPAVNATYIQVETASVSPLALSVVPVTVTAVYTQVETASVTPLGITTTITSLTAVYTQVETAAAAPLAVTLSLPSVTAAGSQTGTAAVTPLAVMVTVASVTATYTQIETAAVAPAIVTITPTETTAVGVAEGTAAVTPLRVLISAAAVAATYVQVETAVISPLVVTVTTAEVTAVYSQINSASVSPLSVLLTIPAVTAVSSILGTASVNPASIVLSVPAVTATYAQVESAAVVPLLVALTIASVTAGTGIEFDFSNTGVAFGVRNTVVMTVSNIVLFKKNNTVVIDL